MTELASEFQSLPPEYQTLIGLAQARNDVLITPLQKLSGGWSGAVVYLVSVSANATKRIEHLILKLDHKGNVPWSDEITRHGVVVSKSPPDFARDHIAEMRFERLEQNGAIAIFYGIAGQSLREYRPLVSYTRQSQLNAIFATTDRLLLSEWNVEPVFEQAVPPRRLLEKWLGFRLETGGNIGSFLREVCRLDPDVAGLLINGAVFPNPFAYARTPDYWSAGRPIDCMLGFIHGDLNTNNILVKFAPDARTLEGYYLIDFAFFKEQLPLLYDQRYLEMSYLVQTMVQVSFEKAVELMARLSEVDTLDPQQVPVESAGVSTLIAAARSTFDAWVRENHPSLYDDLWAQYWLAGVAAGLSFCHKPVAAREQRLAGLIYAAANLKRFAAQYPLARPGEVQQLYDESRFGAATHARPVTTPRGVAAPSLPGTPSTFVGRREEVATARALLLRPEVQLITLTGPGGTGKSRLSLEVAAGLQQEFTDGVFFVSLGDVTDPAEVIPRIAQQLEVRAAGSQPLSKNLKEYLYDKNILLLLDNFEQLIPSSALVGELLAAAPALKMLVTSRIVLNLRGEHELPVRPLEIPDPAHLPPLEGLAENESVRLFLERARAAQPGFTLTANNAETVARICQRLDGLPLAIELAAARVKMLPPQAILARLTDRFKLLTGGARDLPARQQTLRSTLDWSYGLLNLHEKTLYARVAVFVGGFGLEDAEAICDPENDLDVFEGISSLVNNSLLKQESAEGGEPRFSMLDTIREYALERLAENGDLDLMQRQHAYHYARIVNEAGIELFGPRATYWLNRLELEYDNIQAVLAWSQSTPEGLELGPPLVRSLNWFWYRRGLFSDGRMWTERILASSLPTTPAAREGMPLQMASLLAMWQGDLNVAAERAMESLRLCQSLEDEKNLAWAFLGTGVVFINMGRDREAHALFKDAQALFEEAGFTYMRAVTLVHLGNVALGLGHPEEAREWLEQAHSLFRGIGEEWGLSFVLNNLGEVARVEGNFDQAYRHYRESEALLKSTGDNGDLARLTHTLGYIAEHQGDYARAEEQFERSLAMFRKLGNKRGIAECLAGLASLRARQGRLETGACLLGAAEALLGASGAAWWPADRVEVENTRLRLQSQLEAGRYEAQWQNGRAMTLEQALAFVSDDR